MQETFPISIFVEAQIEVLDLMKTDVLERFKKGQFFKQLLVEVWIVSELGLVGDRGLARGPG